MMLIWAILGAEWLLRARSATAEDVENELRKIGNALETGTSDLNLAVFVLGAAQKVLRRDLEKPRYVVSYGTWTVPSRSLAMALAKGGAHPRLDYAQVPPILAVSDRRGPLPALARTDFRGGSRRRNRSENRERSYEMQSTRCSSCDPAPQAQAGRTRVPQVAHQAQLPDWRRCPLHERARPPQDIARVASLPFPATLSADVGSDRETGNRFATKRRTS